MIEPSQSHRRLSKPCLRARAHRRRCMQATTNHVSPTPCRRKRHCKSEGGKRLGSCSRDPIGYGDEINQYLYVQSNPLNQLDPRGLYTIRPEGRNVKDKPGTCAMKYPPITATSPTAGAIFGDQCARAGETWSKTLTGCKCTIWCVKIWHCPMPFSDGGRFPVPYAWPCRKGTQTGVIRFVCVPDLRNSLVSRICGFELAQVAFRAGDTGRFQPFRTT